MTSAQQRLKVTANQIAHLPVHFISFFFLFFKGMDRMGSGERMSARRVERRNTGWGQERWGSHMATPGDLIGRGGAEQAARQEDQEM